VQRDCSRRGYTTDQVLAELDRREPDSEAFIRPQRRYADIVVSFVPGESEEANELDAQLILGPDLPHPDLTALVSDGPDGISMVDQGRDRLVVIPGKIDPEQAAEIEEAIWQRMHFASHLRAGRLGEFTVGTQLLRSESLAIVQLLVLYHLATATAAVALGGTGARTRREAVPVPTPVPAQEVS
jgi:phosphoribulokinase